MKSVKDVLASVLESLYTFKKKNILFHYNKHIYYIRGMRKYYKDIIEYSCAPGL